MVPNIFSPNGVFKWLFDGDVTMVQSTKKIPSGKTNIALEYPIFNRTYILERVQFSITMLVYRSVTLNT